MTVKSLNLYQVKLKMKQTAMFTNISCMPSPPLSSKPFSGNEVSV